LNIIPVVNVSEVLPNLLIDSISWSSGEFNHADRTEAKLRIGQYANQPSLNYTSAIYIPTPILHWLYWCF